MQNPLPGKEVQIRMAPYHDKVNEKFKTRTEKARTACVLILIYPVNEVPHLVLMKRPSYDGHHSGQISFPGGKHENEETYEETALREAKEELRIAPEKVNILGQLTTLFIPPSNFEVLPFISVCKERPVFIKDPKEVEEVIEIDLPHILSNDSIKEKPMQLSAGFSFTVPYFDIKDEVVWGATAMILFELREILKSEP
ncbi:MAG: CoA pyrophosphatase [Bacteroidetes bacterium]|nr:CoA pyrophosphatase [Bacteroidota bacterium]